MSIFANKAYISFQSHCNISRMNPKISIITITYNAAANIEPTMLSVGSQSYTDFEHIIIDGASTDGTLAIARRTGTRSLRILSEKDSGLYDAMNKGLAMARGEYLLFLNAGDAFHTTDTLRDYASHADGRTDIIYSDTVVVDRNRKIIAPRHLSAPELLTFESFSDGMLICHQAFMVRRAIAPKYDLSYRLSADYDWTIRCIQASSPERCINLHTIGIDYLSDGLTDRNHLASLAERFAIMRHYYGLKTTVTRHVSFVGRAIKRRLVK